MQNVAKLILGVVHHHVQFAQAGDAGGAFAGVVEAVVGSGWVWHTPSA
jgi:hypothetical protein